MCFFFTRIAGNRAVKYPFWDSRHRVLARKLGILVGTLAGLYVPVEGGMGIHLALHPATFRPKRTRLTPGPPGRKSAPGAGNRVRLLSPSRYRLIQCIYFISVASGAETRNRGHLPGQKSTPGAGNRTQPLRPAR